MSLKKEQEADLVTWDLICRGSHLSPGARISPPPPCPAMACKVPWTLRATSGEEELAVFLYCRGHRGWGGPWSQAGGNGVTLVGVALGSPLIWHLCQGQASPGPGLWKGEGIKHAWEWGIPPLPETSKSGERCLSLLREFPFLTSSPVHQEEECYSPYLKTNEKYPGCCGSVGWSIIL